VFLDLRGFKFMFIIPRLLEKFFIF